MALGSAPLSSLVGAEIKADKKTLLSGGAIAAEIRTLLEKRGVLVARNVGFDDADEMAFARTLGTVRLGAVKAEGVDGIMKVTFDEDKENPTYANYFGGTFFWHVDGTYDEVPPFAGILTPRVLSPTGGQTEFANLSAAYDALPEWEKEYLDKLMVVHTIEAAHRCYTPNPTAEELAFWSTFPVRVHPLVWEHRSGRKSLVLSTSGDHIEGMGRADSDALLKRLLTWATQPQFVYQHHWQMDDLLLWDNTGMMHRVLKFDIACGRRLHRVTLEAEEPLSKAA